MLSTPTSMALGVGAGLGAFMSEVDQGAKIDSGDGDITIVDEKTNSTILGDESGITNQPKQDNSSVNWAEEEGK